MDYIIKTSSFEGPLDLLLDLIKNRKMDINDLKISQITNDYLKGLEHLDGLDIDSTSNFLEMATRLLQIKSKMLIPKEIEKKDPRAELVQELIDYQAYKKAVQKMKNLKELEKRFIKRQKKISVTKKKTRTIDDVFKSYQKIFQKKFEKDKRDKMGELTKELSNIKYTVEGQLIVIKDKLENEKKINIESYFLSLSEKEQMITSFGAILELLKRQFLSIVSESDKIFLERKGIDE